VNIAAEARIEKHVPSGMEVVVIDIDAVAIPLPIAAARNVVRRDDPIGLVIENDVSRARIEAADDNDLTDVRITAVLVPTFVFAVVVAVALVIIVIAMLVPARVFRDHRLARRPRKLGRKRIRTQQAPIVQAFSWSSFQSSS
jgi:hypothetical protein